MEQWPKTNAVGEIEVHEHWIACESCSHLRDGKCELGIVAIDDIRVQRTKGGGEIVCMTYRVETL